jgi:hypothetical protein
MDFDREWTAFALEAEEDTFGMGRIAAAHNKLRAENAALKAELEIARSQLEIEQSHRRRAALAAHISQECAEAASKYLSVLAENAKLRAELESIRPVFIEAQHLIHSGYDGPFMGEAVEDLVKAVLKAETVGG